MAKWQVMGGFVAAVALGTVVAAQQADPRVGLKAGANDAGVAAKHMELVATLPKAPLFADPTGAGGLNFANSDLAFAGTTLILGNFNGVNFYNIADPAKPSLTLSMPCPGGQGDVSVYRNLLFMSVEQARGRLDCGMSGVATPVSPERFLGVRIFDISNPALPKQIAAVQTCRGSHTHTLLQDPKDSANVYIYGSGTGQPRAAAELSGCSDRDPGLDPNSALFSIDVIKVPLANPAQAAIVSRPRIFSAPTGEIAGLWLGGTHGEGTQRTSSTNQCHDITVFPKMGLAAGACSGNGILLDITDPVNPKRIDQVLDKNFAYWHSATFNNDGTKVIFTDEWGGGTSPRCRATDPATWGADAIFDIVDRHLVFRGYFKLPAAQTAFENCVAHNGSIVPVPGRDIMVQAWYQGGVSVFDFTDSTKPVELAYFDRGPVFADKLVTAGQWSTYWYNGFLYGSEIHRGLDVFRLLPSELLTRNELDAANQVTFDAFNAQEQPRVTWPASFVVARAYMDQLRRSGTLEASLADELTRGIARVEAAPGGSRASAGRALAPTIAKVAALASSTRADAARVRALIDTLNSASK